ncbi:gliding motility-associated C-terminal domain-containing protein [Flavivirga spongiicola]|uniref:Gliding motility-associated C-terminal domain-containing protein n=1 Tax=Flavivirga spongiicola TaxID=421621 RepID=A0ABU7XMF6_9FLAO|nr:gliding motility-associated C-terminal domain-containing protein [Flavivirga sp. MEBiC05379]MDO5981365.1 gliding motility-associated C-terminal domain-containing protein [Flavivirga sp. MEBiC05379]
MKKLLPIVLLLLCVKAYSQTINIPDANFKAALIALGIDTSLDGEIQVNEALVPTNLSLDNLGISNLTGIEFFTSLTDLSLRQNNIGALDFSSNTSLATLDCYSNPLTSLNLSANTALTFLIVNTNGTLTSLDLSSNTALTGLICSNNNMTSLDLTSNTSLVSVSVIGMSNLTSLSLPNTNSITTVNLTALGLTSLDLSSYTGLITARCGNNSNLIELNIKNGNIATLSTFNAFNNPSLSCISVDDVTIAASKTGWQKDAATAYALDCPIVYIPDANFKAALIARGVDTNLDSEIQVSEALIPTDFNLANLGISDLTGIEYFTSLTSLRLNFNNLSTVDLSSNIALNFLYLNNNSLTSLDLSSNTTLRRLYCVNNTGLSSLILPSTAPNLEIIAVQNSNLSSINVSPYTSLISLNVKENNFTNIDVSSNTSLVQLDCSDNNITSLNISTNTALANLTSNNNNLTSLDTSTNSALSQLSCVNNPITSLDLSSSTVLGTLGIPASLTDLNIKNANITNLYLDTTVASGLTCIYVDDITVAQNNVNMVKRSNQVYIVSGPCGPTVSILNAPTTVNTLTPFNVTFLFDRDVTGFDVNDIVLTNATASNFSAASGPNEYTALITPTSLCNTDITINVPANAATDVNSPNLPNSAASQVTITTTDGINPIALTNSTTVALDANGQVTITGTDIDNGSSDNCGIASMTPSITTFDCTNLGNNTVTLTVTDTNNNVATNTAVVTVEDNTLPIASTQNITIQLNTNGQATIVGTDIDNGSTDNCAIVSRTVNPSSFNCTNLGANTVTLTVTDPSGNTDTETAVVTIEDNVPLTAVCQNITIQLDANGQATITPSEIDGGSGSGCGTFTSTISKSTFSCADIGANNVTLTVDDGTNTASCTAVVTVEDTLVPTVITQNITVPLDAFAQASIVASDIDNGSTDNCGIASMSVNISSFDCSTTGDNTVILSVTDNEGNVGTGTAIVTVTETISPVASANDITLQLDASGQVTVTTLDVDNGSSDNCAITGASLSKSTFTCADLGVNEVVFTVNDASGNTDTTTIAVTVEDVIAPTAVAQNITVQLDANGQATITGNDIDNGSSDNCTVNLTVAPNSFTCSDIGQNVVVLTVTDGSGNSDNVNATVTIEDTVTPNVITQNITIALDANEQATVQASDIDNGSTDSCGISTTILDKTDFTCSDLGANTVTLTVTDSNGNSQIGTATVTVEDTTVPIVVTQDITVQLDADGQATISAQDIDNGSSDSCSGIDSISLDITSFNCPALGDVTVTLTVTDNSGNSATETATVTIESIDENNNNVSDNCESLEVIVPGGFSPNGDSIKDIWIIENIEDFPNNNVQVFNRWGELVFEANNYQNNWNGVSNKAGNGNKKLPVGAYLYIINLNEAEFSPKKGWIYINY